MPAPLNIGAVSQATGIPVSTLRTWERRYGVPRPERTDTNQRLYDPAAIEHLRLVARALALGHRPAQILRVAPGALRALIDAPGGRPPGPEGWLDATRALDAEALGAGFHAAHARLGLVPFLEQAVGPYLRAVGDAWAAGGLQTFHEHFASEQLHDFLVGLWRPANARRPGPPVVCATLPGEHHALGLHMAAAILADQGLPIVFLGPDSPLVDLRDAVLTCGARALVVSVSSAASPTTARAHLVELRRLLPPRHAVIVGGTGAPDGVLGVETMQSLAALVPTAAALRGGGPAARAP